jgi:hypothetical protein
MEREATAKESSDTDARLSQFFHQDGFLLEQNQQEEQ